MVGRESARSAPHRLFVGRRIYRDIGELGLVALAFLLYFLVRGNVVDRDAEALAHGHAIVNLEKSLGIYWEADLQRAILDSKALVRLFDAIYFWLDFPLITALGIGMYIFRRRQYTFARDALLVSGGVALIIYHLFPVAPPRLLPESGLIDTLARYSHLSYQAQSTQTFVNPYAAVPSLHVGWAFLLAVTAVWAWPRNRLVWMLAALHPVSQSAATVFTGNHYFFDAAAGLGVAAAGLTFAMAMQRWGYGALRRTLGSGMRRLPDS